MLPEELLLGQLNQRFPCRELQIRQLSALYSPFQPCPPSVVAYGLEATGKSSVISAVLDIRKIPHTIINSKECITSRHLLERTIAACLQVVEELSDEPIDRTLYSRCENISALCVHLQRVLEGRERVVLVFDGIDRQREAPPTLIPALARFGEIIPNLSIIFVVSIPRPRFLHASGTPHVHFPAYTREESICILSMNPPRIFLDTSRLPSDYTEDLAKEDDVWVWARFLAVVWDSLAKAAARDIVSFRAVADKLWRPFVAPVVDGTFGTRDFSRLLVSRRALFQEENMLVDSIVPRDPAEKTRIINKATHDLPYYSKYLLCAAYLASYNPARQDSIFFMKSSEKKRRRKGGATAGRPSKHRKIPRHLLNPSPFSLDRFLAIFHVLIPHPIPQSADIYTQIATLSSLRLLIRTGAAGADVLDPSCKWRVNFGWEYVAAIGRSVSCEISDYLASGMN